MKHYRTTIKIMKDGVGCIRSWVDEVNSTAGAVHRAKIALPNDQTLWIEYEDNSTDYYDPLLAIE